MSVPNTILELVERFDRQRDAYRSGDYNEARLRREFLDPFFGELGWDMDNLTAPPLTTFDSSKPAIAPARTAPG